MLLDISDRSDETLQQQIVRQLRARILAGELAADAELPSIRALARQLRVSVITVSRAYELLVREGLVHARRGRGFFVSTVPDSRKGDMARQRLTERLHALVAAALDEGMSAADIRRATEEVLANSAGDGTRGDTT